MTYGHIEVDTTYVIGNDEIVATPGDGMALWRERLFVAMWRTAARASAYFSLPPERVIHVGRQVEI